MIDRDRSNVTQNTGCKPETAALRTLGARSGSCSLASRTGMAHGRLSGAAIWGIPLETFARIGLLIKFSEETIASQGMRTRGRTEVGPSLPPSGHDGWWLSSTAQDYLHRSFGAVGLDRERLTGPDAHIPFDAHVMLLENAARALREPCFGFRLGSEIELTEAGLVAYVTLNSPDPGAALRNLCRYLVILTEESVGDLRQEAGDAKLLFSFGHPVGTASRQLHEFGVTIMARVCETITGHRVDLSELSCVTILPAPCWPGILACRWRSTSRTPRWFWMQPR
jgi:hypothetical protein